MQVDVNGSRLEVQLRGGSASPLVCWSHGLLMRQQLFEPQIAALTAYRHLSWDHRGQGLSAVPAGRIITIDEVTADAIALIEQQDAGPVHFVGLSMGGFVGMRIAARRPDLIRSLVLIATAPDAEPRANLPKYNALKLAVRLLGVRRFLANRLLAIFCAKSFLEDPQQAAAVDRIRSMLMANGRSVIKAVNGVLERPGVEGELANIRCPTLVLRGTEDAAIAKERSERLLTGITGATWGEIPGAGHSATLERPERVTEAVAAFLALSQEGPHRFATSR